MYSEIVISQYVIHCVFRNDTFHCSARLNSRFTRLCEIDLYRQSLSADIFSAPEVWLFILTGTAKNSAQ